MIKNKNRNFKKHLRSKCFLIRYIDTSYSVCYNRKQKGGGTLKKDIFNGNIKHEYVSYTWTSIILLTVIFLGCGTLFLFFSFSDFSDAETSILLLTLGITSCLIGILYPIGAIFTIRKYPKYKKAPIRALYIFTVYQINHY